MFFIYKKINYLIFFTLYQKATLFLISYFYNLIYMFFLLYEKSIIINLNNKLNIFINFLTFEKFFFKNILKKKFFIFFLINNINSIINIGYLYIKKFNILRKKKYKHKKIVVNKSSFVNKKSKKNYLSSLLYIFFNLNIQNRIFIKSINNLNFCIFYNIKNYNRYNFFKLYIKQIKLQIINKIKKKEYFSFYFIC